MTQINILPSSSVRQLLYEQELEIASGSPLIWTMVHPSMDTWCPTYTWSWQLAEYMPTMVHPLLQKPVLLFFALWNIWSNPGSLDITRGMIRSPNMLLSGQPKMNKYKQLPAILTTTKSHQQLTQQNGTISKPALLALRNWLAVNAHMQ